LALRSNSISKFDSAVKYITKAAAVDTGAIEKLYDTDRGFTYAVAAQANAIDFVQNRRGDDFAAHFSDQLKAYEYILDHATDSAPLSQVRIRELHSTFCAHQDTYRVRVGDIWEDRNLEKGAYKSEPNTVIKADGSQFYYCPPEQVSYEMQRLLDQTNTLEFNEASGVVQAAYVHHIFTIVHPFSDGNGRVSRALASIYLVRAFGIPLLIHADQRDLYFDALEDADRGNSSEFTNFIYDRIWETVELITDNINGSKTDESNNAVDKIREKYASDYKNLDQSVDLAAKKISDACCLSLNEQAERYRPQLDPIVDIQIGITGGAELNADIALGYREVYSERVKFRAYISTNVPSNKDSVLYCYDLVVPVENTPESTILVVKTKPLPQSQELYARLSECGTSIKSSLKYRMDAWAEKVILRLISELSQ